MVLYLYGSRVKFCAVFASFSGLNGNKSRSRTAMLPLLGSVSRSSVLYGSRYIVIPSNWLGPNAKPCFLNILSFALRTVRASCVGSALMRWFTIRAARDFGEHADDSFLLWPRRAAAGSTAGWHHQVQVVFASRRPQRTRGVVNLAGTIFAGLVSFIVAENSGAVRVLRAGFPY